MKNTNDKPFISINFGKTPEERQDIDNSMEEFSQKIRDTMAYLASLSPEELREHEKRADRWIMRMSV